MCLSEESEWAIRVDFFWNIEHFLVVGMIWHIDGSFNSLCAYEKIQTLTFLWIPFRVYQVQTG